MIIVTPIDWDLKYSEFINMQIKQVLVKLERVIKFFLSLQLIQFDKDARVETSL